VDSSEDINTKCTWPDVRQSLFGMEGDHSDSPAKCFIDHIGMSDFNVGHLAWHYQRAADQLVDHLEQGRDLYNPDGLFMPVGYLYRHCLELKLKRLLSVLVSCGLTNADPDILDGHDLGKLWRKIKPALREQWPKENPKSMNNVEALINDFIRIDKAGQSLRYATQKNGADVREKFPKIVRLDLLRDAFTGLYNFLDACESYLEDMQQACY